MVIKDYRWIGMNRGNILLRGLSINTSKTMTLMYMDFQVH
jgi:hypothetical protein